MKTTTPVPDVDELNRVQALWMTLEASDSNAKEICDLFTRTIPRSYISVDTGLTRAQVMLSGGPVWAYPPTLEKAIAYAKQAGIRTDVLWACPKWIARPLT